MDDGQLPSTSPLCVADDSGYYSEGAFKDTIGMSLETSHDKVEPIQKSLILTESPTNTTIFIELQPADATIVHFLPPDDSIVKLHPADDLSNHAPDANSPTSSTSGESTLSALSAHEALCESSDCDPWDCEECNDRLIDAVISYENM